MKTTRHIVTADKMIQGLDRQVSLYASATVVDGTRNKAIGRRGTGDYVVLSQNLRVAIKQPQIIYEGPDPIEAARRYNNLG